MIAITVLTVYSGGMIYHGVFFDCTADLVGQLNGNGQKGMLQIDAPSVENFWLRHARARVCVCVWPHSQNARLQDTETSLLRTTS